VTEVIHGAYESSESLLKRLQTAIARAGVLKEQNQWRIFRLRTGEASAGNCESD
jgi:hypothetical protein